MFWLLERLVNKDEAGARLMRVGAGYNYKENYNRSNRQSGYIEAYSMDIAPFSETRE